MSNIPYTPSVKEHAFPANFAKALMRLKTQAW